MGRRKSAVSRNMQAALFIFTAFFVLFGTAMLFAGRWTITRDKRRNLYVSASEICELASASQYDNGLRNMSLRMDIIVAARCTGNHILLCSPDGSVVSDSDVPDEDSLLGETIDADIIDQIYQDGGYEDIGTLGGIFDENYHIVGRPIVNSRGYLMGYVFVSYAIKNMLGSWSAFSILFVMVGAVLMMLVSFCEYVNGRRLAKPLRDMAEAANRFGHGDYSARVTMAENDRADGDELTTLTDAFNSMADNIQQTEERRSAFVANVSHELRTPMTTISGFADGLLDGTIPQEQQKKYLEIISSETKRLSRLVRSMLDMSRLQSGDIAGKLKPFDLGETMVRTVLTLEKQIEQRKLDIQLDIPEETITVLGDVDSITRVIYNLAHNAVKFADEGSTLRFAIWRENGRVYTSVRDHGVTIPPEELDRIFERFHKADTSRSEHAEGVGLGLYMVREIIAAHGQDIFVTSQDGETTFTFTLAPADAEK